MRWPQVSLYEVLISVLSVATVVWLLYLFYQFAVHIVQDALIRATAFPAIDLATLGASLVFVLAFLWVFRGRV